MLSGTWLGVISIATLLSRMVGSAARLLQKGLIIQDRILNLTGIHNFRDYGGYAARGGHLRTQHLWRSGQHVRAVPQDLELVHRLRIGTVIDLRGDTERAAFPCVRHEDFAGAVLFHPGETSAVRGAAPADTAAEVRTAEDAHRAMMATYGTLPFGLVLTGTLRLYVQTLATSDAPSLLHCLAGKDRTGFAVAVVHRLMGVHPDDIATDYTLTNVAGDPEARIAAAADRVRAALGPEMEDAAVRVFMSVAPEFLDHAFDALERRHGSVEAYAADVLGADAATVAAIAERLIV